MTIIRLIDASADPVPVTCRRRHDPALRCAARSQTHVGVGKDLRLHAVEFVQHHEIGVNPGGRARLIRPHEGNAPVTERATLDPRQPPRPAAVSRHQLAEIWGACDVRSATACVGIWIDTTPEELAKALRRPAPPRTEDGPDWPRHSVSAGRLQGHR